MYVVCMCMDVIALAAEKRERQSGSISSILCIEKDRDGKGRDRICHKFSYIVHKGRENRESKKWDEMVVHTHTMCIEIDILERKKRKKELRAIGGSDGGGGNNGREKAKRETCLLPFSLCRYSITVQDT